jgi:uncharacterized membrane protein
MDTKKILVAVALFAMVASPAFATFFFPMPSSDVEVENENHAYVSNDVTAVAKTGDNEIEGGRGTIRTGDAIATALVTNTVNTNDTRLRVPCIGCNGDIEVENENSVKLHNDVTAVAKTGDNEIEAGRTHGCGGSCSCPKIVTGVADSLATVINVVNTNVTRIRR